ncbi:hypothetical protein DV735_g4348, partial [Chaetothyriales sp. CBS 134920]
MESNGISPASLSVSDFSHYPTPSPAPQEIPGSEAPKKKRKAWGQPVPEIKQILPPRKRAKTAEEKEQRKNERILRNRRAADKSRQRQKAAVAELEAKACRMEQEMAALRATVAGYQERFGVQKDLEFDFTPQPTEFSSPPSLDYDQEAEDAGTPMTPVSYLAHSHEQPLSRPKHQSPSFMSDGMWGYQPVDASLPAWAEPAPPVDLLDDLSNILDFNALANVPDFSNLGTEIGNDFSGANLPFAPQQLRPDSLFDFDAFDIDQAGGLSHEASEPTARLQPSHGAPTHGSDRKGFAAGAPGSQITAAQLGLPESFTPPRWRFPSRMFPGQREGEWEPVKIQTRVRRKEVSQANGNPSGAESKDVEMPDAPAQPTTSSDGAAAATGGADGGAVQPPTETTTEPNQPAPANGSASAADPEPTSTSTAVEEDSFEADPLDEEGAVYPIVEGRIENWSCFFALLSYIHKVLSPHFHSPLLMVAQPAWSARDKEIITQFVFENWKVPAFCMFDAALAAAYAYSTPSALVVDVGLDKCDVTAVTEFVVNDDGRAVAFKDAGGRSMTRRLLELLQSKGFDESMAEQLKKSAICEILPPGTALPSEQLNASVSTTAAAVTASAPDSAANPKGTDGQSASQEPKPVGVANGNGTEGGEENEEENDGVLDVAAIVARDNAAEVLAKREAEKAAKAAAKKGGAADAPRAVRLKNAERAKAVFSYEEIVPAASANGADSSPSRKRKRETEVGLERFMAATPLQGNAEGILEKIAAAVHRTALGVHDPTQRPALWDNLIVLGNGARAKGFTQALISTLASRYTLSPSTATIFTSELPSNLTTPVATPGTNTPVPGHPPHPLSHPASHGVNPLLVAATRNVMQPHPGQLPQHLQVPGTHTPLLDPAAHPTLHRGFSQSPTGIKTAKVPEYFPEWKDPAVAGMEEAAFLGAQVAAKVVFITDQGASKGFMTRTEYNDVGPSSEGGSHSIIGAMSAPVDNNDKPALQHNEDIQFGVLTEEELAVQKKLMRKIDSLIMPLVVLVYLMNYIDRNNYAAARLQGLEEDLNLSDAQYQTGLSLLFVGYVLAQVPSNLLLNYFGRPSLYLGFFIVAWGLVSAVTSQVKSFGSLLACRLILGLVEAPFFPGVLFYLSKWYTKKELNLRMSIFYAGSLLSGAFGTLIAAGILEGLDGARGISAWQWLYIIEGAITIFVGIVVAFVLPDFPQTWKSLSPEMRHVAIRRLALEAAETDQDEEAGGKSAWIGCKLAFTDPKTYILAIAYMGATAAAGFQNFFPTLTATLGYSRFISLLLVAPPYIFVTIWAFFHSLLSDHYVKRFWFIVYPIPITWIGFIIFMLTENFGARYFSLFLMSILWAMNGTIYAWIASSIPRPPAKRAAAFAFINSIGNTASIWTPFTYKKQDAPFYRPALGINIAMQTITGIMAILLRFILIRQNRELDRLERENAPIPPKVEERLRRTSIDNTFPVEEAKDGYRPKSGLNVRADHGDIAGKGGDGGEEVAKQDEDAVSLDEEADQGPAEENEDNAGGEGGAALDLLASREKGDCLLQANDQDEADQEEDLRERQGDVNSPASFEKALSKLAQQISAASLALDISRSRARRSKALWTLYTTLTYLIFLLLAVLVLGPSNWSVPHYAGVVGAPLLILAVRQLITLFFDWRIARQQSYLEQLQQQREEKIADLKKATKYDSTQELLQKYGAAPPPNKQQQRQPSSPSQQQQGAKRKVAEPQEQVQRTGILPPPTANIQVRKGAQLATPQRVAIAPASPEDSVPFGSPQPYPQSPVPLSPDGPGFAPEGFNIPPPSAPPAYSQSPQWYDRILDVLLGEDETAARNRFALICSNCRLVNGQAPPGVKTLEEVGRWRCSSCGTMNGEESEAKKVVRQAVEKANAEENEGWETVPQGPQDGDEDEKAEDVDIRDSGRTTTARDSTLDDSISRRITRSAKKGGQLESSLE